MGGTDERTDTLVGQALLVAVCVMPGCSAPTAAAASWSCWWDRSTRSRVAPGRQARRLWCYHDSLEPFMSRRRALRAQGVSAARVDTVRFAEVASGIGSNAEYDRLLRQL